MKNHCITIIAIALSAASCAAQPAKPIAEPPEPAAARPAKPATPTKPVPGSETALKEQSKQLKIAADQVKKMEFMLADSFGDRDDANRTLVVPREAREPKNESEIEEDLNVMARILEKASTSHDERAARSIGIYYRSPFGNSAPPIRNMYLEGYGAIFFLNVNYSLMPPPLKGEEKPAEKNSKDAEWEKARRELEQPRNSHSEWVTKESASSVSSPPYDAERVETLQKDLAQALRNAMHIRGLKSGETVTVIVTGRGTSGKIITTKMHRMSSDESGESFSESSIGAPAAGPQQRLIIRAKKSDIEAFQNEKLSLDEFRKKLSVSLS